MPYTAEISRRNPTCFLFLVDQSGSMAAPFSDMPTMRKDQFVADAMNKILGNIVLLCAKSEGIRDYFHIGVIGYGAGVGPALSGNLTGEELVPISVLADQPARVEERRRKEPDGAGGVIEVTVHFPVWLDPQADGGTPMCQALDLAECMLRGWVVDHPDAFPPVVINITDGASTDGDPTAHAEQVKAVATSDGSTLLLNLHVSSLSAAPVQYPHQAASLPPDDFAQLLFRLSSPMPPHMLEKARAMGYQVQDGARGFVFNGQITDVVDYLEIGTTPANLR